MSDDTPQIGVDFAAFLRPNLKDVDRGFVDLWRPEISDPTIREKLLNDPRFEDRILRETGRSAEPDPAILNGDFEGSTALLTLLRANRKDLIQQVGCVWRGCEIAQLIASGQARNVLPNIPVETLKKAMRLRDGTQTPKPGPETSEKAVEQDGLSCLQSWIAQFPTEILDPLSLTEPELVLGHHLRANPAKTTVVDRVLKHEERIDD